jgi:hypothetical protein
VIAAAGLLLVIGLGAAMLASRSRGDRDARSEMAVSASAPALAPTPPSASAPAPPFASRVPRDARPPEPQSAETAATAATPDDEVPVWQRRPLRTDQPFPEGARFDPPMPPIKLPPEMLVPIPSADAAAPPSPP